VVTIRPYTNRAAEQAMRQNRKIKYSGEESSGQGEETQLVPTRHRSKPQHLLKDKHLGFSNKNHQGLIVETQMAQERANDQSISDEIATGESIDSVEASESQIAADDPGVQTTSDTHSWVRLYYPLASYFPDYKSEKENTVDLQDGGEDDSDTSSENETESTPWWQQNLGYFNDYRNFNWGASALRDLNVEAVAEAADSVWARSTPRPIHIPEPISRPEPSE